MDIAGDLERFLSEDLYPYRYPLTIGFAVALLAALAVAYRLGWHIIAWRRRLIAGPALVIFLVVAIPLGDYLLSPLWERTTVCEASPIPGAGAGAASCDDAALASTGPPTPTAPQTVAGSTPGVTGAGLPTATPALTEAPPAQTAGGTPAPPIATGPPTAGFQPHVVRQGEFEGADDFHFGNGTALLIESAPGVYVLRLEEFSVRNGPDLFVYLSPDPGGYDDAALNLGGLKGTDGAFNYDVPPGTDVSQYRSAIVWCKAFSVLFAHATFGPDL
jgi:hypothetical protein